MTNLEYIICEAEQNGEIDLATRNAMLCALYQEDKSDIDAANDARIELDRIKSKAGHSATLGKAYKSNKIKDATARDVATRQKISNADGSGNDASKYKIANAVNAKSQELAKDKKFSKTTNKMIDSVNNGEIPNITDLENIGKELDSVRRKSVKESVDALRLEIFEAEHNGTIDLTTRNAMLCALYQEDKSDIEAQYANDVDEARAKSKAGHTGEDVKDSKRKESTRAHEADLAETKPTKEDYEKANAFNKARAIAGERKDAERLASKEKIKEMKASKAKSEESEEDAPETKKAVNESADEIRKSIYEKELAGKITVEEREALLSYLESKM